METSNNPILEPLENEMSDMECRICLRTGRDNSPGNIFFNLFGPWKESWEGMESSIAQDLIKLTNIIVEENDGLSGVICSNCCTKLQDACSFTNLVKKNDRIRRDVKPQNSICGNSDWPKPIQVEKSFESEIPVTFEPHNLVTTIKEEILSDHEITDDYQNDYSSRGLDIKIEPEELTPKAFQISNGVSLAEQNKLDSGDTGNGEMKNNGSIMSKVTNCDQDVIFRIKEEPNDDSENFEACEDLSLECMLCSKSFKSVSGLKAHVITEHSYKTVKSKLSNSNSPNKKKNRIKYQCATCNKNFVTRTDMMVHATCHNKATCHACSRQFDSFKKLSRHRTTSCDKAKEDDSIAVTKPKSLHDVKRIPVIEIPIENNISPAPLSAASSLVCPKCNEEFSDAYYMKIHQEIHHNSIAPERNIIEEPTVELKENDLLLHSIFGLEKTV